MFLDIHGTYCTMILWEAGTYLKTISPGDHLWCKQKQLLKCVKTNHKHHAAGSVAVVRTNHLINKIHQNIIFAPKIDPMTHQRFTGCDPVTALQKIQRGDLRRIAKCSYAKLQRYICKASWAGRIWFSIRWFSGTSGTHGTGICFQDFFLLLAFL